MWEIVGAITAIVAVGVTVTLFFINRAEKKKQERIAEYEARKAAKEQERELKDELRMANFRGGLTEEIASILNLKLSGYETNEEARASYTKIWGKLNKIEESLEEHFEDSKRQEINRIAKEITDFTNELKEGRRNKTEECFKHITAIYERYKELGGNHYVDEQYKYILTKMKELIVEGES